MIDKLKYLDLNLFLKLNSFNSEFADKLMYHISGQIIWIPYFLLIIFLFVKKSKIKALWGILFLILAVGIADYTSVHAFKFVFKRLRPCHNPEIENIVHLVNNHCGGKFGFVSSHSANFFSLAMFSSLYIEKKYFTFFAFFNAALVAYSRIYLGVHYPADVIGGAFLGMLIAFVFYKIYLIFNKNFFNRNIKT